MRTFITSSQDATLYERYPTSNTGLDEILEVGKVVKSLDGSSMYASGAARFLINWDIPSLQQYPTSSEYYLNLRLANSSKVDRYQVLEVCPISKEWIEGSGYFYQDVRNSRDGANWYSSSKIESWATGGGDFTTGITSSYSLSKIPLQDIRINVTELISPVVAGTNITPWNGLIIKYPTADELDQDNIGNIKFFSGNTHTIFSPKLEVVWNDQSFITGSLKQIPGSNISVIPKNIKQVYTRGERDKIYLIVRDTFPDKRFDAVQRYRTMYYLPSQSYFRIRDSVSDAVIYDFDQYSAINCDSSGSYFILDTAGLEVNRYYTVDVKVKTDSLIFFPKIDYSFKIDEDA